MEHHKYNDAMLNFYYCEMNNEYNDGWWKQHYKILYENRLSKLNPELKRITNKHTFIWRDCYARYINLDNRPDRLEHIQKELYKLNINADRQRGFLPDECLDDFEKVKVMYNRTKGAIGCHFSQVAVMKKALDEGKSAFVMEDDIVFCKDALERLDHAQDFLNKNEWDVFWLGGTYHLNPPRWHDANHTNGELRNCDCNLNRDVECTNDEKLVRTYGCWSTYAYIVNYNSLEKIIKLLDENLHESIGIDWLFIKLQPKLKCYAFVPGIVKQYDNPSNIGDGVTYFSEFSKLGTHWWSDEMKDFDYKNFNWHEAKTH